MSYLLKDYPNAITEEGNENSLSAEYTQVQSIIGDGGHRFGISSVAFDAQEDLLWMGNQGGHVTSYYGLGLQKYTSFRVHASNEIRQILSVDSGILALTCDSLRCQSRQGIPIFTYSTDAMQDMQCMMVTGENTLLMGGHQDKLLEIDLTQIDEIRRIKVGDHGCAILRRHPRFICSGDVSGKVTLRDPKTLQAEHVLEAHNGTLSDFDVDGNLLITCGFSRRLDTIKVDRFLMVYDLRVMRAVAPIQLMFNPFLLRFVPTFTSRVAVLSQSGHFQLLETGALMSSSVYMYHINSQGSVFLTFDVSSSYQALAFGDQGGYIHLFCSGPEATFNPYSRPTEFVEPVEPLPFISIKDSITPLSSIPVPFCQRKYLSDWPPELCRVVHRRTPNVNPEILQTMKMVQSIGYAPNPGNRRRNQVPYQSYEKRNKSSKSSIPESPMDESFVKVPKRYRKVDVKYTKLGLEDFDFDHYNKTSFAGLEASLPNSYCNAMLQVLYFIEPIRCALLSHYCHLEFCMACELGFLFQMLDNSKGMPCQASNFLRAFRTIPEASALGLILSEAEESKKKLNLIRLIQSWNIFILQQLHAETMELADDATTQDENRTASGRFDSSHQSFISRLFGMEFTMCNTCRCGKEEKVDSTTILFSLVYPDCTPPCPGKPALQFSFAEVLNRSLCLEQVTQAWCEKCEKYQPTTQSRRLRNLPDILSINCVLDSAQCVNFWKTQMELLVEKENGNANKQMFPLPLKPCRYGDMCTKKDCKFQHTVEDSGQNTAETPFLSWLPLGLNIELSEDGSLDVAEVVNPDKATGSKDHRYHLTSVVSQIRDPKGIRKDSLVACVKAGPNYHLRSVGSPVSQWYLFNDFTITPIAQEEAIWFSFEWKTPCVLFYSRVNLNEKHSLKVLSPITRDIFLEDKTFAMQTNHRSITITPLEPDELHSNGDIVAMDAEFVTLNQEEAVIRSDGTRSTIKPSQMSVARITCLRGQGPLEGIPFIDDYISTQEQVVDYLTKFSGIKPGDLDASLSSKHLTTLKSTYMKLRYLIDCGVRFVGHGLKNDFRVINLIVPAEQVIDTVLLFHLPHQRMVSLRFLAWHFLGLKIQSVTHDSIEDARTALKLYRRYQELESEDKVHKALKELYENGRNLQWKVPGMEE